MKRLSTLVVLVLLCSLGLATTAPAADYKLDTQHTSVVFKAKHMDIGYIYGMFLDYSGNATYDPDAPENTSINFTVDAGSVFTNVKKRDNHLRSSDFFNVKQYPEITFESTNAEVVEDDKLRVTGDFTMHGVTKEITTDVKFTGSGEGPQGNFRRGFYTKFTVNRLDYKVDYMPDAISKDIKITVTGEMIRQ